ncbi:CDP-glycerol glycerophosphotransferase family protein [Acinetobacter pseudolwoffii]|uniref:CDP-glycerol glycerophosphotransferase family protein n=1 Tax=Acinetobacter pseudolwoffii TaxID=2053287 RepID=UPI002468EAE7|nr:CDP-glycerol glycerophosphotransferase family protein [Acinetobacter pseudolwoffii]MDH5820950.1 CDP-glycerol glycerophosphotransferase family protein [Acinetobacter pseudolwoffii]
MIDKLFKQLVYFFSGWIKRDSSKWVFASHNDFGDNARYLFQDTYNPKNIRKIWIATNKNEYHLVKNLGYECYLKGSLKAKYHALTAKKYIYTCYISDIGYQYSRNAICINLWHGIPLKKIEFDIQQGALSKKFNGSLLSRLKHPEIYRKHDYVLCPSNYIYEYSFASAFKISEAQTLKFAYPRSIFLKNMTKKVTHKNFLYVPTWRDNGRDLLSVQTLDLNLIDQFCRERDCYFNIKFHPNTNIEVDVDRYTNISIIGNKDDPNRCLADADFLITDYSSIFFDYLVFNKPILFYVYDEMEYKSESREIYPQLNFIDCGQKVYTQNQLLLTMDKLLTEKDGYRDKRNKVIEKFGLDIKEIDNSKLYDFLCKK